MSESPAPNVSFGIAAVSMLNTGCVILGSLLVQLSFSMYMNNAYIRRDRIYVGPYVKVRGSAG